MENPEKNENTRTDFTALDMDNDIIVQNDAGKSMNNLLSASDQIIDKHYPLHKLTR